MGQNKATQFRISAFVNLVRQCQFSNFIINDQYSVCKNINNYIQGGGRSDDIGHLMESLYWPHRSHDMQALVQWMRKWNTAGKIPQLGFYGLDIDGEQCGGVTCSETQASDDMTHLCQKIGREIEQYSEESPKNVAVRDHGLFRMFRKIHGPTDKSFLFMHNIDVQKRDYVEHPNSGMHMLGMRLYEKYGDDYYSIGNAFFSGNYVGVNPDEEHQPLETSSLSYKLDHMLGNGLYFHKKRLHDVMLVEGLGVVDKRKPQEYQLVNKYGQRFDALLVINEEEPVDVLQVEGLSESSI